MSSAPTEITTAAAPRKVLTSEIRDRLKNIALDEVAKLPELLEQMEPKDRVQYALKLLSFVAPQVKEVGMYEGEPFNMEEALENMKRETANPSERLGQ